MIFDFKNNFLCDEKLDKLKHIILIDYGCAITCEEDPGKVELRKLEKYPTTRYTTPSVHAGNV